MDIGIENDLIKKKELYLFGAGETCNAFLKDCKYKDQVKLIFDNNCEKKNSYIQDIRIEHPSKIKELDKNKSVFVITTYYSNEIKDFLKSIGIKNIYHFYEIGFNSHDIIVHPKLTEDDFKQVHLLRNLLEDNKSKEILDRLIELRNKSSKFYGYGYDYDAFFSQDILKLQSCEIFIDGGAYNGDTINQFMKIVKGKYEKIYAFEPDKDNFYLLKDKLCHNENICAFRAGLWKNKGKLAFLNSGNVASHIDSGGDNIVNVESIDNLIQGKVTFIKLDIEGAEMEALVGAKRTIEKYKPKLAISVYHKKGDLWEIPLWLKNLVPEYKFYIRHHSYSFTDTVLYAIVEK